VADWPGLAASALYQGRDLQPTLGLDALIVQVVGETFGIERERVSRTLFPGTVTTKRLPQFIRS
jgi:uncharacterized protein (DUF1501 family)